MKLDESLLAGDLKYLVSSIFEIDNFKSKIGDDKDMIVLSFNVKEKAPANDLSRFLELGYDFVLDADSTNGPLENGKYKVFVELKRNKKAPKHIMILLDGIKRLTGLEDFKFRYHKSFRTLLASEENLESIVPINDEDYSSKLDENKIYDASNFFNKSYLDKIDLYDTDIIFKQMFSQPIKMKIKEFGLKEDVYKKFPGKLDIRPNDMSEILYLTKYLGNYNITKIGDTFIFENNNYALALEKY